MIKIGDKVRVTTLAATKYDPDNFMVGETLEVLSCKGNLCAYWKEEDSICSCNWIHFKNISPSKRCNTQGQRLCFQNKKNDHCSSIYFWKKVKTRPKKLRTRLEDLIL